jgi:Transposase DDE domain group 1
LRDDTIPQTVLFPDLFNKPLIATFDQPHASSDGGAILLKAANARYGRDGLIEGFARCLVDHRQPGKVRHALEDLLAQRIFGLACGHPDGNDADRLADDPIHKLLLGRDPIGGDSLASQPTISRFENRAGVQELYAMGRDLADSVVERHRQRLHGRARTITIDLDPTDDPTHGAQQLTFFNGHYDSWCYLPLLAFLTFNDEREQYLCAALLRPGNAAATRGALGLLRRLLPLLRLTFPKARFLVRLDGGFAAPEIFDFLDAEPGLDYVVAMAENAVLARHAAVAMVEARAQSEASEQTAHVYTEVRYAAGTWAHERRVVIKAEVVRLAGREPRDNARYVITNLRQTPKFVYEHVYCARGDIENRIKELHDGLQIGRTSCCRFWANQLRVLLTAAAYVLMQELRLRAARTAYARTQVTGLRERLLKLGAHVVVSTRRIVLHLPTSTPGLDAWRSIALALGARTG